MYHRREEFVLSASHYSRTIHNILNRAQEDKFFVLKSGTVEKKMYALLDISAAPTNWFEGVLKTVFKFMFTQITEISAQSCDGLDSFRVRKIKETA